MVVSATTRHAAVRRAARAAFLSHRTAPEGAEPAPGDGPVDVCPEVLFIVNISRDRWGPRQGDWLDRLKPEPRVAVAGLHGLRTPTTEALWSSGWSQRRDWLLRGCLDAKGGLGKIDGLLGYRQIHVGEGVLRAVQVRHLSRGIERAQGE
jgi:hypothetical protein